MFSHIPDCSFAYFLSSSCILCFLSLGVIVLFFIYSVLLFHESLSPPHWGALVIYFWVFSSSCSSLFAATYIFLSLYYSVSFAKYASHLSSLLLFWIVASIVYSLCIYLFCMLPPPLSGPYLLLQMYSLVVVLGIHCLSCNFFFFPWRNRWSILVFSFFWLFPHLQSSVPMLHSSSCSRFFFCGGNFCHSSFY